jgi:hypothetical protein
MFVRVNILGPRASSRRRRRCHRRRPRRRRLGRCHRPSVTVLANCNVLVLISVLGRSLCLSRLSFHAGRSLSSTSFTVSQNHSPSPPPYETANKRPDPYLPPRSGRVRSKKRGCSANGG